MTNTEFHCFIIAEAGVNHNGSLDIAKKMVDVAASTGVDAIKFQTFKAELIVIRSAAKARYQIENTGGSESQYKMLKKLELSDNSCKELSQYCRQKNIIFLSTPFDEKSADLLDKTGMDFFKIASGEITNKRLIQHIALKNKPIILSTGMSCLGEIEEAIEWIQDIWSLSNMSIERASCASRPISFYSTFPPLTLLHCISNYPAEVEEINLSAMGTMRTAFGLPVGYSDHSIGIEIPVAAVALGASIVEKHFTLDKNMEGPDHKASLNPSELGNMVRAIRNIEKALGNAIKKPSPLEIRNRTIVRKSIVALRTIKANTLIYEEDVAVKRPGTGIAPKFIDIVIGMRVKKDIKKDAILSWEDLKDA